jgi:hypothetical protein
MKQRGEEGQALIVVAGGLTVLLIAAGGLMGQNNVEQ